LTPCVEAHSAKWHDCSAGARPLQRRRGCPTIGCPAPSSSTMNRRCRDRSRSRAAAPGHSRSAASAGRHATLLRCGTASRFPSPPWRGAGPPCGRRPGVGTSARAPRPTPLGIPLLRSNAADPMSPAADGFRSAMDVAIPKRTRIGECAAISPTHTNASPTRRQREEAAQTCTGCLCRSSGVGVGHGAVARYSGAADSVLASQTPEVAPAALSDSGGGALGASQ